MEGMAGVRLYIIGPFQNPGLDGNETINVYFQLVFELKPKKGVAV